MKYTLRSMSEKRELVVAWRRSGLSASRFGRLAGVSATSLRDWSVGLPPPPATATATQFVDVEVVEPDAAPSLVVEVAHSGHRVIVPPGFDAGELRRLVAVLC